MRALAIVVYSALLGLVLAPVIAGAVAVARASQNTVDAAITLVAAGVLMLCLGVAASIALYGASHWRQAQHPPAPPADVYDNRRQAVVLQAPQQSSQLPPPVPGETAVAYRARVQQETLS